MSGIGTTITSVVGWVKDIVPVLTEEPFVYYLAASLITVVIGIFAKGKKAVK